MSETLTCFKSYDIRGELGLELNQDIAYRIGRAAAQSMHARSLVLGCDARETSPELADAVAKGAMDAGTDVLDLGLCGTEEMYWAVSQYEACLGIEVTASHNPIHYNGMKIVKLSSSELSALKKASASVIDDYIKRTGGKGGVGDKLVKEAKKL